MKVPDDFRSFLSLPAKRFASDFSRSEPIANGKHMKERPHEILPLIRAAIFDFRGSEDTSDAGLQSRALNQFDSWVRCGDSLANAASGD